MDDDGAAGGAGLGLDLSQADVTAKLDQPVELRKGQWASFSRRPLEIAFLRVVEDSRCPSNVECVRQGDAILQFQGKSSEGGFGTFLGRLPGGAAPADTSTLWTTWGAYRV